jgi:hypothetical protein
MAKTEKPKAAPKKRKKAASASRALVTTKVRKSKGSRSSGNSGGFDSLSRLLEHPLVAELISVGAIAAVAAIADHNVKTRTGEGKKGSKKALKAAGTAAATAIGKRLMSEVDEIKKASKKSAR